MFYTRRHPRYVFGIWQHDYFNRWLYNWTASIIGSSGFLFVRLPNYLWDRPSSSCSATRLYPNNVRAHVVKYDRRDDQNCRKTARQPPSAQGQLKNILPNIITTITLPGTRYLYKLRLVPRLPKSSWCVPCADGARLCHLCFMSLFLRVFIIIIFLSSGRISGHGVIQGKRLS